MNEYQTHIRIGTDKGKFFILGKDENKRVCMHVRLTSDNESYTFIMFCANKIDAGK